MFRPGLTLVVTLALGMFLSGCGGEVGPEDTVRRYFDALSARDSARAARVFIPEVSEGISRAALPEISIENLKIEKISETEDTSEVTAEYDAEITRGEGPTRTHDKVTFIMTKTDGEWLISALLSWGNVLQRDMLEVEEAVTEVAVPEER
ncbi:MAG: nuclear transport factor 2 family protein [Dehalococcoidia bacterium]|nr:nuclear transport factor 2 family protein [Dehalococcoidia bacterium]